MSDHPVSRRAFVQSIAASTLLSGIPVMSYAETAFTQRMTVGDLTVTALSDGHFDLPAEAFQNLGTHSLASSVRAGATLWAISTGTRSILVDAGSGDFLKAKYPATGQMVERLTAAGINPTTVSDIIVTHMHADHIGGLMKDGQPVFPNAVLHMSEVEWTYWTAEDRPSNVPAEQKPLAGLIQSIANGLPYARQLHAGAADLGEGVRLVPAPGHTPGHAMVHLSSGADQLLLVGDAMIADPLQFERPQVTYVLDSDPERALQTRLALFERMVADEVAFCATHLNGLGRMRLERAGDSYRGYQADA